MLAGLPAGITLRRAVPGDADTIRALTRDAYARWVPVLGREPAPMVADYERAVRVNRIDLAEAAAGPVGLIETVVEADALLIENVAVLPASQRRGLGRALLAHAERVAAAAGLGAVRLYANARMTENIALYRAVGYRVDGEIASPFGRRILLRKSIG